MKRISQKLTKQNSARSKDLTAETTIHSFAPNEPGWISTTKGEEAWKRCVVLSQSGILLTVRIEGKKGPEMIDLRKRSVFPANNEISADMTTLHHLNEPCILFNLEKRIYNDESGTFIGPVLVSVNPLKDIPFPKGVIGTPNATKYPQPYAIAEFAYSQMSFAGDNRRRRKSDEFINQSVIASGESGAGKTEASKKVLKHLVERAVGQDKSIDQRLLTSNPITEAFGNAKTLRNDNSSRFGKFMKLHFKQLKGEKGTPAAFEIAAASIETYLLERSRVTNRETGERNFHIFYYLLAGLDGELRKALHLDKLKKVGFRYMVPLESPTQVDVDAAEMRLHTLTTDTDHFVELEQSMLDMGFHPKEIFNIFRVVVGVLHLGNVAFTDKTTSEGEVAKPVEVETGYDAIECAADLLGVDTGLLEALLLERTIETREGKVIVHRNKSAAAFARDAVAKNLYNQLWEYVIRRVNQSLDETSSGSSSDVHKLPTIGVLDIFGFESFQKNGFEQLLINYTNEALQSVFNKKVFESELALYRKEGLVLAENAMSLLPPSNESAMTLLAGQLKNGGIIHSREYKDAILVDLDYQSREIKPSDEKLLALYKKKFSKHPNFVTPHPKFRHEQFIIKHYAGLVAYTVGNFIEKNNDALPQEANQLFAKSTSTILQPVFKSLLAQQQKQNRNSVGRKKKPQSIVRAFREQIIGLLNTLEGTACSFIRCVKPNASNRRNNSEHWFSRKYVSQQLKHLSIPQTALVLRSGLPTRVPYEDLVDSYMSVLPKEATRRFKKGQVIDAKVFVSALFWAFEIDRNLFKLGHTRVFFRAGEIASLDRVMQRAQFWASSKDKKVQQERQRVAKRFTYYYARLRWRRAWIKVRSQTFFLHMLTERRAASIKIQSQVRRFLAHCKLEHLIESKRKRARELERKKREEEEKLRKIEEERKQQLEKQERANLQKLEEQATLRKQSTKILKAKEDDEGSESSEGTDQDDFYSHGPTAPMTLHNSSDEDEDEEDEIARYQRYVAEVEKKANEATDKEIARRESRGKSVTHDERVKVLAKYEREYMKEFANYDALRQHEEEQRSDLLAQIRSATTSQLNRGVEWLTGSSASQENSSSSSGKTGGDGKSRSKSNASIKPLGARRLSASQNKQLQATLKDMKKSKYVQETLERTKTIIAEEEAKEEITGGGTLRREATVTGDQAYIVDNKELETPVKSARDQLDNLHDMVARGDVSTDEFATMVKDIARALGRKSSSVHSEKSDNDFFGIPIKCVNPTCGASCSTAEGPICLECGEFLQVDLWDQTDAFPRPDTEDWTSKVPLQFQGGKFFARLLEQNDRFDQEFKDEIVFTFELAWQKRVTSKIQTRWCVRKTPMELESLHKKLLKSKQSITVKGGPTLPDTFPKRKDEVRKQSAAAGARYSRVAKAFGRVSLRKIKDNPQDSRTAVKAAVERRESAKERQRTLTKKEYADKVRLWLSEVFEASSQLNHFAKQSRATNPIFKTAFEQEFAVSEHVRNLLKTRGR